MYQSNSSKVGYSGVDSSAYGSYLPAESAGAAAQSGVSLCYRGCRPCIRCRG